MWKGKTVSVVFSTYRDVKTVRGVIDGLFATGVVDEVVAVDNNAQPGTKEEIAKTKATYVLEPRQGLGHGFHTALGSATGDILITMEADGTYTPDDVHKLLAYSDDFDVVCGTRTASLLIRAGAEMSFFTRYPNVLYAKAIEVLFNTANLTDVGCIYRLMKRPAWERIQHQVMEGGWTFNLDWMLHMVRRKMRFVEIPVNFLPRAGESVGAGKSKLRAAKIALLMLALIVRHRFNVIKLT